MKVVSVCAVVVPLFLTLAGCGQRERSAPSEADGVSASRKTRAELLADARKAGPRRCSEDWKFISASEALGGAREQMQMQDYRRANIRLRDGLEILGEVFLGSDVLDHRGQRLAAASSEDWNGRLKSAAEGRQSILESRLADYAQLKNLTGCPTAPEAFKASIARLNAAAAAFPK
jgi:hypothetical protein